MNFSLNMVATRSLKRAVNSHKLGYDIGSLFVAFLVLAKRDRGNNLFQIVFYGKCHLFREEESYTSFVKFLEIGMTSIRRPLIAE